MYPTIEQLKTYHKIKGSDYDDALNLSLANGIHTVENWTRRNWSGSPKQVFNEKIFKEQIAVLDEKYYFNTDKIDITEIHNIILSDKHGNQTAINKFEVVSNQVCFESSNPPTYMLAVSYDHQSDTNATINEVVLLIASITLSQSGNPALEKSLSKTIGSNTIDYDGDSITVDDEPTNIHMLYKLVEGI